MKEIVVFENAFYIMLNETTFLKLLNPNGRCWESIAGKCFHPHMANMPLFRVDLKQSVRLAVYECTVCICVSINAMKMTSPVLHWNDGSKDIICLEGALRVEGELIF